MIQIIQAADDTASLDKGTMTTTTHLKIDVPLWLENSAQNYPWGKIGSDSRVAQLLPDYDKSAPYAELWVGAHPKSPSVVHLGSTDIPLDRLIAEKPEEILGQRVYAKFGPTLPFLFKILSVNQALSIQAHPNKDLAVELHRSKPEHYPDDNHKPEMSIPLTELKLLYNFRTLSEIRGIVDNTPELATLFGRERVAQLQIAGSEQDRELLKDLYASVIRCDRQVRANLADELLQRLQQKTDLTEAEALFVELSSLYGKDDVGLFSVFLLNICTRKPGEAVYIGPNIPHAYLSGDMVECMANSDNVVRAGLTPKYQDADTLISMLTYDSDAATAILPEATDVAGISRYTTPVAEFAISELKGETNFTQKMPDSPLLIFCLQGEMNLEVKGENTVIGPGQSVLIPHSVGEFSLQSNQNSQAYLVSIP